MIGLPKGHILREAEGLQQLPEPDQRQANENRDDPGDRPPSGATANPGQNARDHAEQQPEETRAIVEGIVDIDEEFRREPSQPPDPRQGIHGQVMKNSQADDQVGEVVAKRKLPMSAMKNRVFA